jgi:hypothetical protein
MIESSFRKLIEENSDIIKDIERFELLQEYQISKLKAKLRLFNGSILWVREIWIRGKLEIYSYYWLRPDETVITGWDNAPHHREIDTFPHHRHMKNRIYPSMEKDLRSVLKFIKDFLGV